MSQSIRAAYLAGIREGLPFIIIYVPMAMLFGVVATEAGLSVAQTLAMSVLVIAGAAQFTAVSQIADALPTGIVIATALAVNVRMAMYSASLLPYLGKAPLLKRAFVAYLLVDQSYVLGVTKFETERDMSLSARLAYIFGMMSHLAPLWYGFTLVGALVGNAIPEAFALDFAVALTFVAMTAPLLKTLAHLAAAVTSVTFALLLSGLPYGMGLLVAAVIAMVVGALVEQRMEGRAS